MQEDEFRRVAELLVDVTDRVAVAGGVNAEANQEIRDWLFRLAKSDVDLTSVLAEKIDRAFPI